MSKHYFDGNLNCFDGLWPPIHDSGHRNNNSSAKCVSENGVSLFEIIYREMGIGDKDAWPVSVQPSGVTLTQPNNTTLLRKAKKMNIVEYL